MRGPTLCQYSHYLVPEVYLQVIFFWYFNVLTDLRPFSILKTGDSLYIFLLNMGQTTTDVSPDGKRLPLPWTPPATPEA